MTWKVIWSKTNTRHFQVNQLKRQKKGKDKSRRIRINVSISRTVWNITTLVRSWSWLDWRQLYDKRSWFFKRLYLKRIPGQNNKDWFKFYFPIGDVKQTIQVQFESDTHIVTYQQHEQNSFFKVVYCLIFKRQTKWLM